MSAHVIVVPMFIAIVCFDTTNWQVAVMTFFTIPDPNIGTRLIKNEDKRLKRTPYVIGAHLVGKLVVQANQHGLIKNMKKALPEESLMSQ